MTGLQIALVAGLIVGLGLATLWVAVAPSQPDPRVVVGAYSLAGMRDRRDSSTRFVPANRQDRLGLWVAKHVPRTVWSATPSADLELLQIPPYRHYGNKVANAASALIVIPALSYLFSVVGITLPFGFALPMLATIAVAAVMWINPDRDVRSRAAKARDHFVRSLAVYCDLIAIERQNTSSARQAMEKAAEVGDNWAFRRILEELQRSRWSGVAPWDALAELSRSLAIPQLGDVADIMRLSRNSSQIALLLRERGRELRQQLQKEETAAAARVGNIIVIPALGLVSLFGLLLVAAQLLRMVTT